MIRQIKCWIIECDKCQRKYTWGGSEYDVFEKKKEAIEEIKMDDWWEIKGNKIYCPECGLKGE